MKTLRDRSKIIGRGSLLTLALGFTATLTYAGPGPEYWQARPKAASERAKAVEIPKENPHPTAAPAMVCPACTTQGFMVAPDRTSVLPGDARAPAPPAKSGFKHSCRHCGGSLTAERGKMTNAMSGNCEMCGKGAARCIAAQHPAMTA